MTTTITRVSEPRVVAIGLGTQSSRLFVHASVLRLSSRDDCAPRIRSLLLAVLTRWALTLKSYRSRNPVTSILVLARSSLSVNPSMVIETGMVLFGSSSLRPVTGITTTVRCLTGWFW